jgi:hypothetical protein
LNNGFAAASVAYDETQTQLEKTSLLPAAAGLFHHDFPWFPSPARPAARHRANAGAIGTGKEEKTCPRSRLIYLQYFHYINHQPLDGKETSDRVA